MTLQTALALAQGLRDERRGDKEVTIGGWVRSNRNSKKECPSGTANKAPKKSYISYNVLRLPIMLEWQKRIGCHDAFLALGPSVEYRWHEHSRYFIGKHKHTATGDINLNPIGLNLEARAGYSGVMLYARAGVTPLLNKTKAPECYPMTIGLGFRL